MTRLPRWASWLDAFSVFLLIVALKIALSSGIRFSVLGQLVSMRQAWRPLLVAAVLIAFRHWRVAMPSLLHRLRALVAAARSEPSASVLRIWSISRFGVLAAGLFAVLTIGRPPTLEFRVSHDLLRDLPLRWDAGWYLGIARDGYRFDPRRGQSVQQTIAFFPAFPMLMRAASVFTEPRREPQMTYDRYIELRDSRILWAGTSISIAAFLAALFLLYHWMEPRSTPDIALTTVMFMAAYPFAVFYSAPYTEGLFLLATLGACLAFERGRWVLASSAGLLAGLTRPNGAMLSLTLALLAAAPLLARDRHTSFKDIAGRLLVAAMPGVGMLLHSAFIGSLTGDPFAWMKVQQAWGRSFASTMEYFDWVWVVVWSDGPLAWIQRSPSEFLQTIALVFALAMVWPVWRRFGAAYAVLILANLVPPLLKGGVLSMGRMTSTLFPVFAALALAVPPERRGTWLLFFALGQGLIAAIFFTWRPVY